MKINITSVFVDDQQKALRFYTGTLRFQKKREIPLGDCFWLTVVSPDEPDGTEFLLEPEGHPAVKPYKAALVEDGIPATSFAVADVHAEYERLSSRGVDFIQIAAERSPQ
jgi:catechol 2,3-dioxygenase-like lactoylglutathione lyase family enzyme